MNRHCLSLMQSTKPQASVFKTSTIQKSAGFSLIEVLVSIIVLSFGLLGMVGLQAAALKANRESRVQSSAVRLARELGELMRSNKEIGIATTNNPYLIDYYNDPATNPDPTTPVAVPAATTNCFTADCSTATKTELAEFEVRDWLTRLNADLPGAKVTVCFDSTPFDASGIPQWACSHSGGLAVIKIGWTKASTNRSDTRAAAFKRATVPSVVLPVTAGSST